MQGDPGRDNTGFGLSVFIGTNYRLPPPGVPDACGGLSCHRTNDYSSSMTALNECIAQSVGTALAEDVGTGDLTAQLVRPDTLAIAQVIVREQAILCGVDWFVEVFNQLDESVQVAWSAGDGETISENDVVCEIRGNARAILSGERTALNFLQTLSGTATVTADYVAATAGTSCTILDTRKTLPGLRLAQKYAVTCGSGTNHRVGLFDAILIKENHIASAGGVGTAVADARQANPGMPIEIEVESLTDLAIALAARAERLLLDNFSLDELRAAVATNGSGRYPHAELEASGGYTLDAIQEVAKTGVDYISVGAITKHVRATDFSMRFEFEG